MKIFPRPYPHLPARRASTFVAVAAPNDLRNLRLGNLRLDGRRTQPRAAWTIDPASHRPVCLWEKGTEALGRAEDEDAQSRRRRAFHFVARLAARDGIPPTPATSSKRHAARM